MKKELEDLLVKVAQTFGVDGKTFTLGSGETLSHVVKAWNGAHPEKKINLQELRAANPGVKDTAFLAGKSYMMPSTAKTPGASSGAQPPANNAQNSGTATRGAYHGRLNNPGNMEYSRNNGWPGQDGRGGRDNRFAHYSTPENGGVAAIGRWMELARKRINPTIGNIVPTYSPATENDVVQHAHNISNVSGIPTNSTLDVSNTGQWVDLARGLFAAESGHPTSQWFLPAEYTNMVNRARALTADRMARRRR